jgi:hypothetical protein
MNAFWAAIVKDLLSKKWLAFLFVIWLSFWGLLIHEITGEQWKFIALTSLGFFAGANVLQKIKANGTETNSGFDNSKKKKNRG